MALKLSDSPKMLSLEEAFRNMARNDPYKNICGILMSRKFKQFAELLKGKGTARQKASIPTIFLHLPQFFTLLNREIHRHGARQELEYFVNAARSLAREFHDEIPSELESAAASKTYLPNCPPYREFKHFYQVYRNANRPASA